MSAEFESKGQPLETQSDPSLSLEYHPEVGEGGGDMGNLAGQ